MVRSQSAVKISGAYPEFRSQIENLLINDDLV